MAFSELVDFFRDEVQGEVTCGLEGASTFTCKEDCDMSLRLGNEFERHPSPLMINPKLTMKDQSGSPRSER